MDYRDPVGYADEEDEDLLDDDDFADEHDLSLSFADSEDGEDPSREAATPEPTSPASLVPIARPFQLPEGTANRFWQEMFHEIVPLVFLEFNVDEELGSQIVLGASDPLPDVLSDVLSAEEEEAQDRVRITWVQASIFQAFSWAASHDVRDSAAIMEEIRGSLSEEFVPALNDWTRHSNGHSGFLRAQIEYGGSWDDGASLNDGFSIQSASRATRTYET